MNIIKCVNVCSNKTMIFIVITTLTALGLIYSIFVLDTKHNIRIDNTNPKPLQILKPSNQTPIESHRLEKVLDLSDVLLKFRWEMLEPNITSLDKYQHRQRLIDQLQKFAFQEPEIPINQSCTPPKLLEPKNIICSNYPDAFVPTEKYPQPVKVGHAIQLGFDADSLEIHLNEVFDVIDYFFILEATSVHCKTLKKKLMWSDLSVQPRFQRFRSKIVHLILDDVDVTFINGTKINAWTLESLQEEMRWRKIKEWNMKTNFFGGNDVIGFGDADEIASRDNIQLLRWCPFKGESLDIGIWFPFGRLDQAYASDFPVSYKYKYTLGDPTFYRWKDIASSVPTKVTDPKKKWKRWYPTRLRGRSGSFLLGGIHLTYYTYLPYFMLKILSASECGNLSWVNILYQEGIRYLKEHNSLDVLENEIQKRKKNIKIKFLKSIKEDISKIIVIPWFYECNRERYPAWKGNHDSRVS